MVLTLNVWKDLFENGMNLQYKNPDTEQLQTWIGSLQEMGDETSCWVLAAAAFIFCISVIYMLFPDRSRRCIDYITRNLLPIALVVWIAGVWIYMIGLYDVRLNGWGVAPRAVIASFGMFLGSIELGSITEAFRTNACYMAAFSCIHFTAVVISFLFLIKQIGFRFWAWLNLGFQSLWRREHVYIFWGMNDESILLAKSIRKREEESLIVFVNTNDLHDKAQSGSIDMSNILDLITLRSKEIEHILQIKHAVLTNCHTELSTARELKDKLFFKALHMNCLGKIIKRSKHIHFFLLSDDEEMNILSAVKLQNALSPMAQTKEAITLYAHARKGRKNEIYDYYSLYNAASKQEKSGSANVIKIKLIDSSNLAITYLKQHFEHHPIHLVDIDPTTATVTSPFHALIIGFGEVGRDAFRFLYEFGAFVGPDGKRSPFHCHTIDANMAQIEGAYRSATTGIVDQHLTLVDTAIGTGLYHQTIDRLIEQLNYVMISINDDDLALATAVRLYRQAMQCRNNNLKHFRIYVHCRDMSHLKRMREVAELLNGCNNNCGGKIVIFGDKQELYTYDLIIDNKIEQEAKRYHKQYELTAPIFLSKEEEKLPIEQQKAIMEQQRDKKRATDVDTLWKQSFEAEGIQEGAGLGKIQDMIRMREQNIANTLHKETKALLLGVKADDHKALEAWNKVIQTREIGTVTYEGMKNEQPRLDNVARCEHIRWEASHQLMGYACDTEKNHIRKIHPDMCPWEELTELTKSYDYNVVDTGLRLMYEAVKKTDKNPQK